MMVRRVCIVVSVFVLLFSVFALSSGGGSVMSRVEAAISDHHVVIFSKSYCPYCRVAKHLLTTLITNNNLHIMEIDLDSDGAAIQRYLQQKTGQRTVPNIFIGQNHIGGNDKLQALHQQGTLIKLINNANHDEEL